MNVKIGEKLSLADILEKGSMSTLRGSPLKFSKRIIEGGGLDPKRID